MLLTTEKPNAIMTSESHDFKVMSVQGAIHMPKQTFFNLPMEKRQKIEQAALDEFSEYGFDNSNMNRIVAQSKIAKGSFYQYFDDKKDLYFHLIDSLVTRKIDLFKPFLDGYKHNSFATNLREMFRSGLEFADSDPKYYQLGEDSAYKNPALLQEFIEKYNPMAVDIYIKLLEYSSEKEELREGINIPVTASFISSLVNQTTINLIANAVPAAQRNEVIAELIGFIERAVLK